MSELFFMDSISSEIGTGTALGVAAGIIAGITIGLGHDEDGDIEEDEDAQEGFDISM